MKVVFTIISLIVLILPIGLSAQITESDKITQTDKHLVSDPVTAGDREGRYIPDLKKEDFTIYQNPNNINRRNGYRIKIGALNLRKDI